MIDEIMAVLDEAPEFDCDDGVLVTGGVCFFLRASCGIFSKALITTSIGKSMISPYNKRSIVRLWPDCRRNHTLIGTSAAWDSIRAPLFLIRTLF